jgi:spermidine/putrescine transport system permease protein
MRTLVTVVLPQLIPAMISGFALAFTLSLDDFVITKFNTDGTVVTLSMYLYNKLAKKGIQPELRAVSALFFIVSLLILIGINIYTRTRAKKQAPSSNRKR